MYEHHLILWHDLINNTLSPHSSNNYKPSTAQQVVTALHQQRDRIRAVIYCRRFGTADIFNRQLTTDILIIRADKHQGKTGISNWVATWAFFDLEWRRASELLVWIRKWLTQAVEINLLRTINVRSAKIKLLKNTQSIATDVWNGGMEQLEALKWKTWQY